MFEHRHEPLASQPIFRRRLARHGLLAGGVVVASLGGMAVLFAPVVHRFLHKLHVDEGGKS